MFDDTTSIKHFIAPSPHFQRAIHIRYDLRDAEAIERYIPTLSAVSAVENILHGTDPKSTQRAHVLYAAYGSGKSLLAVALAALLENSPDLDKPVKRFTQRIYDTYADAGDLVEGYRSHSTQLLPVVLSGDEGDFATSVTRALTRALKDVGLETLKPQTRFNAALRTIEQWENDYQDTFLAVEKIFKQRRLNLQKIKEDLGEGKDAAYNAFEAAYVQLTGGAVFNHFAHDTPENTYREVAKLLVEYGYAGIAVIWDEFGRYFEARTSHAFGAEAALLQAFAESCNHSGEHQVHLLLFAHKELQNYASSLPKSYQLEWLRIAGRFQTHNVTGDPYIAYRLIANAFEHTDDGAVRHFLKEAHINRLVAQTVDAHLFGVLTPEDVRSTIYATWPLHPLTVFTLTRLSNKVAQNERTMFTFLTVDEPYSLSDLLGNMRVKDEDYFIRAGALWEYFSETIRADTGVGGAHRVWSGVSHALGKIPDEDMVAQALVKTLGVLTICADQITTRPTTNLLCWAVGAEREEQQAAVVTTLENLRRRKVIINRKTDGYWTFTSGSDIDFEQKLTEVLDRINPTHIQLRRMLEQMRPAPFTLARRYNQNRAITRFFRGLYRWAEELVDAPWDEQINQLDNADGLVIYVLATDDLGVRAAHNNLKNHERVVYVITQKPLIGLGDVLREVFGLQELKNDPDLKREDDRERIQRELDWLMEDAETRLDRELAALIDPRAAKASWIVFQNGNPSSISVSSSGQATRLVSDVCERSFQDTPTFNSEGLNKRLPTGQQINASQKVIDAILTHSLDATLGFEGYGPEVAALHSLLTLPGILRQDKKGRWIIERPDEDLLLGKLWDCIDQFLVLCREAGSRSAAELIDQLIAPPFGLRRGVIPILLAAVLRSHVRATTIRNNTHAVHPIDGILLVNLVAAPDQYTIEIGEWSKAQDRLWQALYSRFESYLHESERYQPPLTILKISMLRWLQALPNFCRETQTLSEDAIDFRNLIRTAQTDPARVLFKNLPEVLKINGTTKRSEIEVHLDRLTSEISNAYLDLQRRLDSFSIREFGHFDAEAYDGMSALRAWVSRLQGEKTSNSPELRFGSTEAEQVVQTVKTTGSDDPQFWDRLSHAATGTHLRDWNDQSETRFYQTLTNIRTQVERETEELSRGEMTVNISVELPNFGQKDFRFHSSVLSVQGKRILQNFKRTLEIAGRPLSTDEKRQIVIAFLYHVMGEDMDE